MERSESLAWTHEFETWTRTLQPPALQTRVPRHEERQEERVGGRDVLLAFAAYLILSLTVGFLVGFFAIGVLGYRLESTAIQFVFLVGTAAATLLSVGAVVAYRRVGLAFVGLRRVSGRWLLIGAGLGLLTWIINRGVVLLYVWIVGDASNPQEGIMSTAQETGLQFALSVLLVGLTIPFAEELLFRGILYSWLRRWGVVVAVAASAVIFGLFHGVSVVLPTAVLAGVFTALAYERSRSLWPAVVAHAVNNTLSLASVRILFEMGV